MNKKDKALALFTKGFSCSQAVLAVFCEDFGLPKEAALRLSQGFGGGMAGTAETCGALTGAILVLGLKHGRIRAADQVSKETTYALVRRLFDRFRRRHGALLCRELLRCDIATPEGAAIAKEKKLHKYFCPLLVESAVEITEEIL